MRLDKEKTWQKLNKLTWAEGLTREQMVLYLRDAGQQLEEELYYHLPANKKFHSAREVIESLPDSVWSGVGDRLHEKKEVPGPKVAPESAARGKTSLKAQMERTRERHLDEKGY